MMAGSGADPAARLTDGGRAPAETFTGAVLGR